MSEQIAEHWKGTSKTSSETYSDRQRSIGSHQNSPDDFVVHLLHRASQNADEMFAEEMKAEQLTPRQFAVLLATSQNEGISQTGLVKKTGIDRSTLADIIRRMLKKNLLRRLRDKRDTRVFSVKTTELGLRVLQTAQPAAHRADEHILNSLPVEKRMLFIELLEVVSSQTTVD